MKATILLLFSVCLTLTLQAQVSKTADVTAGSLKTTLSAGELYSVTQLTLTGTIDARDFKTMRDDMPALAVLDLSAVTVAAYSGFEGTEPNPKDYPGNTIPVYAFYDQTTFKSKSGLRTILLPNSVSSIGNFSFYKCSGLASLSIPSSVTSVGYMSFYGCGGLASTSIGSNVYTIGDYAFCESGGTFNVDPENTRFSGFDGVLFNKEKTVLIQCPASKTGNYDIPATVTSINNGALWGCTFTSINTHSLIPIDLSFSSNVFKSVDKTTCILYVPVGTKNLYAAAGQWKDFTNIVEVAPEFQLSSTILNITASGGSPATLTITCNGYINWTANSDQAWLTIYPATGKGDHIITFAAEANPSRVSRKAQVTVSATGIDLQIIYITQDGINTPLNIMAGGLKTNLTPEELANITKLTLTGTIDARDFKTMRDDMPLLAEIDLSGATVAEYTGTEGTTSRFGDSSTYYANAIPANAFCNEKEEKWNTSLTSFVFPSNVTSIEWHAFLYCTGLNSMNIPSSLISIGDGAFALCTGLTSLNIPSSVISIGDAAFMDCSNLTSVIIPSSVASIGAVAFAGCTNLTSVNIPFSVTNMGWAPFEGSGTIINVDNNNSNYSSVDGILFNKTLTVLIQFPSSKAGNYNIPTSVKSIKQHAFGGCTNLTSVTISSSVDSIEIGAFINCRGLSTISIPSSVSSIGEYAFAYCAGLSSIYANSGNPVNLSSSPSVFSEVDKTSCTLYVPYESKKLYAAADQWKDFTNIVEMPGLRLSASILSLKATHLSRTLIYLHSNVNWTLTSDQPWLTVNPLYGTGTHSITFTAEGNTSLNSRTANVKVEAPGLPLQTITVKQLEAPYKSIGITAGNLKTSFSFEELTSLMKLKLTGTIDARDFKTMRDDMPNLIEIDLSEATIAEYIGLGGTSPSTDTYLANTIPEWAFFYWDTGMKTRLTTFVFPPSITAIGLRAFSYTGLTSATIPTGVTTIDSWAFASCRFLIPVTIPLSVISIGNGAFVDCPNLSSVTIPSSVTSIGIFAFGGGISDIKVDVNNPKYSSFDGVLFNKRQTILMQYPNSRTGAYEVPASVTEISASAFEGCYGLTSVSIPSLLTTIGERAFSGCGGLTSLTIPSSVIYIGGGAFNHCTGLTSMHANASTPVNLIAPYDVFYGIDKTRCTLFVPFGTASRYASAIQWRDFTNIVEAANGLNVSANNLNIEAAGGSTATINVTSNVDWTVSSDKTWLTFNPGSGSNNSALTFTAKANLSIGTRIVKVTVSATGVDAQQIIIVNQNGSNAPLNVTAGDLATGLTSEELASITKLTLSGTIDARDFKTMRDDMPNLAVIDLSGATIVAYNGTGGTSINGDTNYQANVIPEYAFSDNNNKGKISLTSIVFPKSIITIGKLAFNECLNLISVNIPPSVRTLEQNVFSGCKNLISIIIPEGVETIGNQAFYRCSSLTSLTIPLSVKHIEPVAFSCSKLQSIKVNANTPVNITSSLYVFGDVNKTNCILNVPYGSKTAYKSANQWKDFRNIVEMPGVLLSATNATIANKEGSTFQVNVTSNTTWSIDCDQPWLVVDITSAYGNKTLTFTAETNDANTARVAMVIVSGSGFESQTILVTQEGTPVGVNDITETSTQFKCYPNPFNSVTTISWQLAENSKVTLKILDIAGRTVETLVDEQRPQGKYETQFKAEKLPKGIYFYQLKAGEFMQTRKMILVE